MTAPRAIAPSPTPNPKPSRRRFVLTQVRVLATNAALIAVTALAVADVIPRDLGQFIAIDFAVVFGIALGLTVVHARRIRSLMAGIRDASPRPLDGQGLLPPGVARLVDELEHLGYRVVGAIDVTLPRQAPFRTWVLVEPAGEVWVEAAEGAPAIAVLLSMTPGGRQIETAWPGGFEIDEPELLAKPSSATLPLTLSDHRSRLSAEQRAERTVDTPPDPDRPDGWQVRSFEDYLAWEPIQRSRTGGLRMQTDLDRRIMPSIWTWAGSTAIAAMCVLVLSATS